MRYTQLAEQCVKQIEAGQLALHSKMPSLRKFKQQHSVSMTTALNCYQHLESLGWLIAKPQSGYYVAQKSLLADNIKSIPLKCSLKHSRNANSPCGSG